MAVARYVRLVREYDDLLTPALDLVPEACAVCVVIKNEDSEDQEKRKIYVVVPHGEAGKNGCLRAQTEENPHPGARPEGCGRRSPDAESRCPPASRLRSAVFFPIWSLLFA